MLNEEYGYCSGSMKYMNNGIVGKVFDIQRFTVHDGPGIRSDVFLKGCPLRCLWCHSPESQSSHAQVAWFEIRCIGLQNCGRCLNVCPTGALKRGRTTDTKVQKTEIQLIDLDRETCNNCGKCTESCPANALCMTGIDMTVDAVMEILDKDKLFYRKSGGGVTVSGGEPMVQYKFAAALL